MAQTERVRGRTRWRRFAILFTPALAIVAVMLGLVMNGVLAVNFAISGTAFKLSASSLHGTSFVQYGFVDKTTGAASDPNTYHAVAVTNLGDATIADLHQTVCAPDGLPFPGMGNLLVTIDAGGGNTPASAHNLVVDATDLKGDAVFTNINIGQDFSTTGAPNPGFPNNGVGQFAQAADSVTIQNLAQSALATSAGSFSLNGLHLSAQFVGTCP